LSTIILSKFILIGLFIVTLFNLSFSNQINKSELTPIYIKKINFYSNKKNKEQFYNHFIKLQVGDKYDTTEVYYSIRRLEELKQFSWIKLIEEFDRDSVTLDYYINEAKKIIVEPYGNFIAKPDTLLNQVFISLNLMLKNPFYRNNVFFINGAHSLPFGYSNIPTIVRDLQYSKLSAGFYNEYFTKYFFTGRIFANYSYMSSPQIAGVDEKYLSFNLNIGKRFGLTKLDIQCSYFDRESFSLNLEQNFLSHNRYPRLSLNWLYDNRSSSMYYSEKTMFELNLMKYGLGKIDSLGVDFYKVNVISKFVTSVSNFKFLTNLYLSRIFLIEKISIDQYLYAGGLYTNRGYYTNTLPMFSDILGTKNLGAKQYDGFQTELRYSFARFGPLKNFFLNYLSSFLDAAIWFDYTSVVLENKRELSYYSYGTGLRLYGNVLNTYWNFDVSYNKQNKYLLSVTNGINF